MRVRGWGILLAGGVLCHDHAKGRPYFVTTKRAALAALERLPGWTAGELVRVDAESHPEDAGGAVVTFHVRPA